MDEQLIQIFNDAQISSGCHRKSVLRVMELYKSGDIQKFFNTFSGVTDAMFLIDNKVKNPYVERIMEFIALVCANFKKIDELVVSSEEQEVEPEEHPFLENFFSHILQRQRNASVTVRIRSCELIIKILDELVGREFSADFCDKIEEAMLERLRDPKLEVCLLGILALHRFQNKRDPNDKIIATMLSLMEQDRFAKVRKLCVEKVCLREDVAEVLLTKIRDVDAGVRLAAFKRLLKVPKFLKIEPRRLMIKSGKLDASVNIRNYTEKELIPTWLSCFDNDFHKLMDALRLDETESDITETNKLCEYILNVLFRSKSLEELTEKVGVENDSRVIPYENLNWETVNYWRILVQFIRNQGDFDEEISQILPELVHFCSYIQGFCDDLPNVETPTDFLQNQFIIKQLFLIAKGYDVGDPVGRGALLRVVRAVLKNVVLTLDTAEVIVANLEAIYPNSDRRAIYINELISEITCPEHNEEALMAELQYVEKVKALQNELVHTEKSQEVAIAQKDYTLAGSFEEQLKQIKTEIESMEQEKLSRTADVSIHPKRDVPTAIKCLDIALGFLLSANVKKMSPALNTLKNETIYELMIHENQTLQAKALHCYGLLCLIDKKLAEKGIHLLAAPIAAYQAGQECDVQVVLVCIGSVVDLIRVHGTQLLAVPEEVPSLSESFKEDHEKQFAGGTSLTSLIQGLSDLMGDEIAEVKETAAKGLCALILDGRVQSSSLLSRLVFQWCNKEEESTRASQLIGVTLQELPKIDGFHKQWEQAILIIIRVISLATDESPLYDVDLDDLMKFMVALYQINLSNNEVILNFAMKICLEIEKKPRAKQVLPLSKLLLMLKFNGTCSIADEILTVCEELRDETKVPTVSNNLVKFMAKLNSFNIKTEPKASTNGMQKASTIIEEEEEESDSDS